MLKNMLYFAVFISAICFAFPAIAGHFHKADEQISHAPDRIIVKFKSSISEAKQTTIHKALGTKMLSKANAGGQILISVPQGKTPVGLVKAYSQLPSVKWAQVDYRAYALAVPNDAYYGYQWHMDTIFMPDAWDITFGISQVIVSVLDTGVHFGGEDLDESRFLPGYDFANQDNVPTDGEGHGTHVTGTIAQTTDNGIGVAGVAPNVTILPVKVLDDTGTGYTSWIANGLYYAADNGADVVNMSLGYPARLGDPGPMLREAIQYAADAGVILVAASGNDGRKNAIAYPAAYDQVIAVGASRYDNKVPRYSNRGNGLTIVAPGGDISVDQNNDGYADGVLQETFGSDGTFGYYFYQGTSMAAPHVSAAAALLLSVRDSTPAEVFNFLVDGATDLGDMGYDTVYGHGLLNVKASLDQATTVQIACVDDGDCDDADSCTADTCLNPGLETAYCENTVANCGILDNCCPSGCSIDNDADCNEGGICGDGICDGAAANETCGTCPEDCPTFSHVKKGHSCCGDGACGWRESVDNCPVDC